VGEPPEERRGEEVPDSFWSSLRNGRKMGCSFFFKLGSSAGQLKSGARDLWGWRSGVSHKRSTLRHKRKWWFQYVRNDILAKTHAEGVMHSLAGKVATLLVE
jgi:hypothetical protein